MRFTLEQTILAVHWTSIKSSLQLYINQKKKA